MSRGKWLALSIVLAISFLIFVAVGLSREWQRVKEAKNEDALIEWAEREEAKSRAHIRSLQEKLDASRGRLAEAEDADTIRLEGGFISSYQEMIRDDEFSLNQCSKLVRSELQVERENRENPQEPQAGITELRRKFCGGP